MCAASRGPNKRENNSHLFFSGSPSVNTIRPVCILSISFQHAAYFPRPSSAADRREVSKAVWHTATHFQFRASFTFTFKCPHAEASRKLPRGGFAFARQVVSTRSEKKKKNRLAFKGRRPRRERNVTSFHYTSGREGTFERLPATVRLFMARLVIAGVSVCVVRT